MPSDKDRLYIALYARGGAPKMPGLEDTYHWALIIGPKKEKDGAEGIRVHAKEKMTLTGVPPRSQSMWHYDENTIGLHPTAMLLVRIVIAKVEDKKRLLAVLRGIPIRPDVPGWNCVGWIHEALETLFQDGKALGTHAKSWEDARNTAMSYVTQKKAAHRFDGKGAFDLKLAATWDMLEGKELIP